MSDDQPIEADDLRRLKWRCRRGLLENDLFVQRFFDRFEQQLSVRQGKALTQLMNLADNDLLDLLLGRSALQGALDVPDVRQVLHMLRS